MFKLVDERTAWAKVTFPGLTEEGERVENEIEMRFVLLSTDENIKLFRDAGELTLDVDKADEDDAHKMSVAMASFGAKIIRDWRGVHEANGDPIKFSAENLARLFNVPRTFEAAIAAYRDAIAGGKDDRSGN